MKKFSYFCLTLVLMLSYACVKEEAVTTTQQPEYRVLGADDASLVNPESAVSSLFSMLSAMDECDETRSGELTYNILSQELVSIEDIIGVTRAEIDEEALQNSFYIVNIEDNLGRRRSAILGASENLPPILAIMNGGDLALSDFEDAWQSMNGNTELLQTRSSLVESEPINTAPLENIISYMTFPTPMPGPDNGLTPGTGGGGGNNGGQNDNPNDDYTVIRTESYSWVAQNGIGPLLYSHYNQGTPFNDDYDVNPNTGVKYYAGCGVVALAQILTYCKNERGFGPDVISGKLINWYRIDQGVLKQSYAYDISERGEIGTINVCTEDECDEFAKLHRAIFDASDATPQSNGAVGLSRIKARNFLREYNFIEPTKCDYSDDLINLMLFDRQLPIYIGGYCTACGGGHAWVIDGKRRCERYANKVYIEYVDGVEVNRYGVSVETGDEDTFIHCNWGYEGYRDGYFYSGIFDSPNAITRSTEDCPVDNYSIDNEVIIYDINN